MKKSGRMQRLADLSGTVEKLAEQALAKAQAEAARLRQQALDLERYRNEYLNPLNDGSRAVGGYEVQKLRLFVARIDQALAQLQGRIRQAEAAVTKAEAVWNEQRRRTQTMNDIAGRARAVEEVQAEKVLQREIDDRPRRGAP